MIYLRAFPIIVKQCSHRLSPLANRRLLSSNRSGSQEFDKEKPNRDKMNKVLHNEKLLNIEFDERPNREEPNEEEPSRKNLHEEEPNKKELNNEIKDQIYKDTNTTNESDNQISDTDTTNETNNQISDTDTTKKTNNQILDNSKTITQNALQQGPMSDSHYGTNWGDPNDPLQQLIEEKERIFKALKEEEAKKIKENNPIKTEQPKVSTADSNAKCFTQLNKQADSILKQQQDLADQLKLLVVKPEVEHSGMEELETKLKDKLKYYIHDVPVDYIAGQREKWYEYRDLKTGQFWQYYEQKKHELFHNISLLSGIVNDVTGYTGINNIKIKIDRLEALVVENQANVKTKKQLYSDSINTRTKTQKDINELLTRKHQWTPSDLERFTLLYRKDHSADKTVKAAEEELEKAELKLENLRGLLVKEISNKYHEEYLWNIKMRGLSTWVTVGLMVLNIFILLLSQIVFEPMKVQRIVDHFEAQFDPKVLTVAMEKKLDGISEVVGDLKYKVDNQEKIVQLVIVNNSNQSSHFNFSKWISSVQNNILSLKSYLIENSYTCYESFERQTFGGLLISISKSIVIIPYNYGKSLFGKLTQLLVYPTDNNCFATSAPVSGMQSELLRTVSIASVGVITGSIVVHALHVYC